MLNYTLIKRRLLQSFICFLALTALIAIISVLSGEFGEIQAKILGTSFTISAASICSMACAAFIEKKQRARLGLSGIGLSVVAAILTIVAMWAEIDSKYYIKTMLTCIVGSVASAHACLLTLPTLQKNHRWIQTTSTGSIAVLVLQILIAIWAEVENEAYFRILAVVAILVGLETLVIPILRKLRSKHLETKVPNPSLIAPDDASSGDSPGMEATLLLEHVSHDVYVDASARRYRVHRLDDARDAPDRDAS